MISPPQTLGGEWARNLRGLDLLPVVIGTLRGQENSYKSAVGPRATGVFQVAFGIAPYVAGVN
jgi:hypothetical protein